MMRMTSKLLVKEVAAVTDWQEPGARSRRNVGLEERLAVGKTKSSLRALISVPVAAVRRFPEQSGAKSTHPK